MSGAERSTSQLLVCLSSTRTWQSIAGVTRIARIRIVKTVLPNIHRPIVSAGMSVMVAAISIRRPAGSPTMQVRKTKNFFVLAKRRKSRSKIALT